MAVAQADLKTPWKQKFGDWIEKEKDRWGSYNLFAEAINECAEPQDRRITHSGLHNWAQRKIKRGLDKSSLVLLNRYRNAYCLKPGDEEESLDDTIRWIHGEDAPIRPKRRDDLNGHGSATKIIKRQRSVRDFALVSENTQDYDFLSSIPLYVLASELYRRLNLMSCGAFVETMRRIFSEFGFRNVVRECEEISVSVELADGDEGELYYSEETDVVQRLLQIAEGSLEPDEDDITILSAALYNLGAGDRYSFDELKRIADSCNNPKPIS